MIQANIGEAKTQFSKYKDAALDGKQVIICERNIPILELKPIPKKKKRTLGLYDGMFALPNNFNEIMSNEEMDQFSTPLAL